MFRPAILLLACLSGAGAAELVVRDLRVGLDLLPVDFQFELQDSTGSESGSDSFDSHYGLTLGGRYSMATTGSSHGAVVGIDLGVSRATYDAADGMLSTYILAGELGYGWAASDDLTLVGSLRLGIGAASASFDGGGAFANFAPKGPLLDTGVRVAGLWTLSESVVLDGTIGWRQYVAQLSADDRDLDISNGGLTVSFGFSWRFTSSPWRLE